jgi:hypothetical protein
MNQYIFLVELSSTEIYHYVVAADSRDDAEARIRAKYADIPHMHYVAEATTFND